MKSVKFILSLVLLLAMTLSFNSCHQGPIYEKTLKMKNSIWDRFDQKLFEIPIEEAGKSYDISLVARNTNQFPYDNLPVYVIITTTSGEERMREITLPVRENGKMLGLAKGNTWEVSTVLWRNISMADKGKCKISIENMIPKIQTEGIAEIGIAVEKSK